MAESSPPVRRPPLGVGALLSQSVILVLRYGLAFLGVYLASTLVLKTVGVLLTGRPWSPGPGFWFGNGGVTIGLAALRLGLSGAVMMQLALGSGQGRGWRRMTGRVLRRVLPFTLAVPAYLLVSGIGLICLVLPGLWLAASLAAVPGVVLSERIGLDLLSRSDRLTRGHRPALAGFLALTLCLILGLLFGLNFGGRFVLTPMLWTLGPSWIEAYFWCRALAPVLGWCFWFAALAALYLRLRALEEAAPPGDLAGVFE